MQRIKVGKGVRRAMVISAKRVLKRLAVFLLAALVLIAGVCYTLTFIRRQIYPKDYSDYIELYSEKYGIDSNLVYAIVHTESGFDSEAVSDLGACGLMQIMPETFEWLGSKSEDLYSLDGETDEVIFDPETNICYGIYFLSLLMEEFGQEDLVILAYHAGMWRVNQWLGDSELSSDGKTLDSIPYSDTEYYLKKVERTKTVYETLY